MGDVSKKTMATAITMTRSKRKIFSDGKGEGRDNAGRRRGGEGCRYYHDDRRGADAIAKTAKVTAEGRDNFMVDEDRDDGDADRHSVVDCDDDGGAGGGRGDALKKTMAKRRRRGQTQCC